MDRSAGGLGIGLALVRQLTELHGGSVAVHSSLGQGSEFVVNLPLASIVGEPLPPTRLSQQEEPEPALTQPQEAASVTRPLRR